jgi:hypothetical protein
MDVLEAGQNYVTFDVLFQCRPFEKTVALSVPTQSTVDDVISRASKHLGTEFRSISIFGRHLDQDGLFADYFEPDATFVLHIVPGAAAGTLLCECCEETWLLHIEVEAAELLLAKGGGQWKIGEFNAKVVGKAPVLVLVEFAGGVCGGCAAIPFENGYEWTADPTGTSFVFSLRPTAARYTLEDGAKALGLGDWSFSFGTGCLRVYCDGDMSRLENTYGVPSGWASDGCVEFARFEVWRLAP